MPTKSLALRNSSYKIIFHLPTSAQKRPKTDNPTQVMSYKLLIMSKLWLARKMQIVGIAK
jgi:hypothetical protein